MRILQARLIPPLALSLVLGLILSWVTAADAQTALEKAVTSGGGTDASGATLRLRGTVGETGVVGRVSGANTVGEGFWHGQYRLIATDVPVDLDPIRYANGLRQNAPNPFASSTSIAYTVGAPAPVRLSVFDVSGRKVATLTNLSHDPGLYRVEWDGRDGVGNHVASGVYFYRLDVGTWSTTKKLLKLR